MNDTATQTSIIPNRSQRRKAMAHQGFLKQKKNLSLYEWSKLCKEIGDKGKEFHQANVERSEKANFEQLREAYSLIMIKDKSTWHTDKKQARNIIKKTRLSLQKRS